MPTRIQSINILTKKSKNPKTLADNKYYLMNNDFKFLSNTPQSWR